MPFSYRVPIPDELASKSNLRLKEWLLNPGDFVGKGFPLALVDTSDDLFALYANGEGVLRSHSVKEGELIVDRRDICAIMADGEKVPYGRPPATWRRINRESLSEPPDLEPTVRPDWEMPANRSLYSLRGHLLGVLQREVEPSYLAEIHVRAESFAIHAPLDGLDIVPNVSLVLHQVELPRTRLLTAVRKLNGWVTSPYALDLELSVGKKEQSLRFSLVSENRTIDSRGHPMFKLMIDTDAFCGEVYFIVDQSCIRIWLDGLERWLSLSGLGASKAVGRDKGSE